jgi:predicted nucleotidyltransferase
MRLSDEEKTVIRNSILQADPEASVLLFGSRVNDAAKGGDIDLLCFSKIIDRPQKRALRRKLSDGLGGQRVDLLVEQDERKPFVKLILEEARPL